MRKLSMGLGVALGVTLAAGVVAAQKGRPGTVVTVYRRDAPAASAYNPYGYGGAGYGGYGGIEGGVAVQGRPLLDGGSFAVVTDRRSIELKAGANVLELPEVAAELDVASVLFRDATDPGGTAVLEQRFQHDLASVSHLLARYLGQPLTLVTDQGERKGTLLSFDDHEIVLGTEDPKAPVEIVQRGAHLRDIRFGAVPGGLVTRPTLFFRVDARRAGAHLVEVTYQTGGMSWSADYTAVLGADEKKVDLSGWLTVANHAGARFADAQLRLVAVSGGRPALAMQPAYNPDGSPASPSTARRVEYRYELPRPVTLEPKATQQLELLPPSAVGGGRILVYDALPQFADPYTYYPGAYPNMDQNAATYVPVMTQPEAYLEIENSKKGGLGMELPAGRVRVYKRDAGGVVELVGENVVDHTARDGALRIRLGASQDAEGSRKQVDFVIDEQARTIRETVEVRVKNRKKQAVEVLVTERMFRWNQWTIENESVPGTPAGDGKSASFRLKVPAGGEQTLTYTVKYQW